MTNFGSAVDAPFVELSIFAFCLMSEKDIFLCLWFAGASSCAWSTPPLPPAFPLTSLLISSGGFIPIGSWDRRISFSWRSKTSDSFSIAFYLEFFSFQNLCVCSSLALVSSWCLFSWFWFCFLSCLFTCFHVKDGSLAGDSPLSRVGDVSFLLSILSDCAMFAFKISLYSWTCCLSGWLNPVNLCIDRPCLSPFRHVFYLRLDVFLWCGWKRNPSWTTGDNRVFHLVCVCIFLQLCRRTVHDNLGSVYLRTLLFASLLHNPFLLGSILGSLSDVSSMTK